MCLSTATHTHTTQAMSARHRTGSIQVSNEQQHMMHAGCSMHSLRREACLDAIHNQLAVDFNGSIFRHSAIGSIQVIAGREVGNSQPLWSQHTAAVGPPQVAQPLGSAICTINIRASQQSSKRHLSNDLFASQSDEAHGWGHCLFLLEPGSRYAYRSVRN